MLLSNRSVLMRASNKAPLRSSVCRQSYPQSFRIVSNLSWFAIAVLCTSLSSPLVCFRRSYLILSISLLARAYLMALARRMVSCVSKRVLCTSAANSSNRSSRVWT
jgi:hypothetical protein